VISGICPSCKTSGAECCERLSRCSLQWQRAWQQQGQRRCRMSNVFHKNPYVVSCERHGLIPLACVFRRRRSPLVTFLTHTQPQRCSHGYGTICSLAVVNELFADQIIRSGREYKDHVNRLQPVSFTCHLVSLTILHTVPPLPPNRPLAALFRIFHSVHLLSTLIRKMRVFLGTIVMVRPGQLALGPGQSANARGHRGVEKMQPL
jgi:hypothetical protein